jgi:hypothetical protein
LSVVITVDTHPVALQPEGTVSAHPWVSLIHVRPSTTAELGIVVVVTGGAVVVVVVPCPCGTADRVVEVCFVADVLSWGPLEHAVNTRATARRNPHSRCRRCPARFDTQVRSRVGRSLIPREGSR